MKAKVLMLVLGVVIGVAASLLWPRFVSPRLPEGLRPKNEAVEGTVVRKQREGERLLLTINTSQGAALATFTERVPEIDLLVADGDTVTLALGTYEPFVENPTIQGVRKREVPSEERQPVTVPETGPEAVPEEAPPAVEDPELEQWPETSQEGEGDGPA